MVSLRKNKSRYLLLLFLIVISCAQKGIDNGIPIVDQNLPEFPNAEVVYLLAEKVIEINKDKTCKETVRHVIKINHEAGKEWADRSVGFNSKYQDASLDFARTVTPDGTVINIDKKAIKTATPLSDYPEYSDYKKLTFTLPSVSVGSIIDYQYTIENGRNNPYRQFYGSHDIQWYHPIIKSRVMVTAPKDIELTYLISNKNPKIGIREEIDELKGKRIYRWEAEDIPRVKCEEDMPLIEDIVPRLLITSENSWDNIGSWFNGLIKGKTEPDDQIIAQANIITQNLKRKEDKIRALYNFVSKDVRYIAVSYGNSGYEPNPAPRVLRNKYGDCKDKATLLISMLNVIDVPAFYAILPTNELPKLEKDIPFLYQFDHCIVAIKENDKYLYIDPIEYNRYGNLPSMDQGRDVFVFRNGAFQFEKISRYPSARALADILIKLEENGHINVILKRSFYGSYDRSIRSEFVTCTKEEYKEFEDIVISRYNGIRMLDSQYSDPFDLNNPLSMQFTFEAKDHGQKLGGLWIVPNKVFSVGEYEMFTQKERVHPLKFDETDEKKLHVEIRIPESYEVYYIPESFEYHDSYYDIVSTYSETNGGVVNWDYSFNRKAIYIPSEDYQLLREKFQDLIKHSEKQIVLKKR